MWMSEALFDARVSPWLTLADATDDELRAALARRVAPDAREARRRARRHGASTGARAGRALAAARPSAPGRSATPPAWRTGARAAKEERAPRRSNEARWPCALRTSTARCAASRWPRSACSSTRTCRSRSRSTNRSDVPRCTSTGRSCAASSSRARPSSRSAQDARLALEDLRARAGGADLRARARGAARERGRGALPHGRPAAPDLDRGGRAAASTGTTRAFNHAYAELEQLALRQGTCVRGCRAARRHLRRHGDRPRRRPPRAQRRDRRARGALARGAGTAAARLRPRDRPPRGDRARAQPAQGRARAARRARRARRRRHRAATRHRGAGRGGACAVRAARLAPVRHPPRAADRRDAARRRADAPGRVPRPARGRRARQAARGRRGPGSSARRSTAGSSRSSRPTRSARSSCASRWPISSGSGDGAWAASLRAAVLLGETPPRSAAGCSSC